MEKIYTTGSIRIDETIWRMSVYLNEMGIVVERYEFQAYLGGIWQDQSDWPTYDNDDLNMLGLPEKLEVLEPACRSEIDVAIENHQGGDCFPLSSTATSTMDNVVL